MITIEELDQIRARAMDRINQGSDRTVIRIATCMATGGIAAGSQAVMDAISDEIGSHPEVEMQVVRKGCIGMCRLDPLVDVLKPGEEKVTYVKMTPERMRRVIAEHVLGGTIVDEYTLHVGNDKLLNDYTVLEG